ncbi:chromosome segregation protein Csm1/Pcs1-domain-containing protein [Lipomyces orientalis]|uniref:Chromosome segregation protein Csm1/Pcs1-domain-containing protein n=1 Tax=Lipomyces orientalis TaxID=1233043 RepID=A0ACC3TX33_9ASCO
MPRAKSTSTAAGRIAKKTETKKGMAAKTKMGTLSALVNSTDDEGQAENGDSDDSERELEGEVKKSTGKGGANRGKNIANGAKRPTKGASEDVEMRDAATGNGLKNKKVKSTPLAPVTNTASIRSSASQPSLKNPRSTKPAAKPRTPKLEYIPETQNAYDNDPISPAADVEQIKERSDATDKDEIPREHYKALQARFAQLSELRQTAAEAALSSYRESAERRYAAADELITTLREELRDRSKQIKEMSSRVEEAAKVEGEVEELEKRVEKLRQENAVLQSKLLARGSTVAATGSSSAVPQLKEDLFSDLSGLIIRDVRVEDDKTVYDCLQTGRNGAFHYKMSIPRNTTDAGLAHGSATANGSGGGYEDTEITFVPMLDDKRDALLMSLLPDYFTEPLTFMRSAAAQCYWKISQALQKKL